MIMYYLLLSLKAAQLTANLTPQQKIEWAAYQRKEGNKLFSQNRYQEAMDVYLTCLVAIDTSNSSQENNPRDDDTLKNQCETEIQLPVLLNLALCALKLGMLSKAEKFCNYAIELKSGQTSVKSYFRRGKVRMLMGNYISAELDLDKALDLIMNSVVADDDLQNKDKRAILREKQKLQQLVVEAEKNQKMQKKAMQRLFGSDRSDVAPPSMSTETAIKSAQQSKSTECDSLYPEKKGGTRKHSTLRDDPSWDHAAVLDDQTIKQDTTNPFKIYLEWYLQMMGRCAQKLLDIIGDDEDDLAMTTATDRKSKVD
jgi:tetratricopeptide (TPR) repeat protein